MSQPLFGKQGNAKVDKLLSQFSVRYTSASFIADQILPVIKVKERTGLIAKYGKENLRIFTGGLLRTPGTRAKGVEYTLGQGSYVCQERSVEGYIPWEAYNNTDDPYDPARDATANVKDLIQQDKEFALATLMGTTAIITNNVTLAGATQWSATTTSTPIDDLFTGVKSVHANGGRQPNVAVFSIDAFWAFKVHPQVRDYVKYTNGGQLTDQMAIEAIKAICNVKEVFIGDAIYNSSSAGQADSIKKIWSGNVWLLYRTPTPTLMAPTFGATITDVPDLVDGWGEIWNKRDVIRNTMSFDQNIIDTGLCYLIKSAVTPS
jgi:hypothetical protein